MSFRLTKHAIERFVTRNEDKAAPKDNPERTMMRLLEKAYPIEFCKRHRLKRLFNNDFADSDYFYNNGWIFVCSHAEPRVVITVERQGHRKFGKDLFRI